MASTTFRPVAAASTPRGLRVGAKSSNGPGLSARETIPTAKATPLIPAIGRQRGESSLPVGKSSMRKRMGYTAAACAREESNPATAPPGNRGIPSGRSATVAYCPESNCKPPATPQRGRSSR
jgi:hypothetical protein